jgi:hypothetical protein
MSNEETLTALEGELDRLTRAKMSETRGALQYHEALKLVARENPYLDRRRTDLFRGRE